MELLAGYSVPTSATAPRGLMQDAGATIGSVVVKGTFKASSIAAGVYAGTDGKFGTADDVENSNGSSAPANQSLISRIANVVLKQVEGPDAAAANASFGIVAEQVARVSVAGIRVNLVPGPDNDELVAVGPAGSLLQIFEI
jgi:hypothetical protein